MNNKELELIEKWEADQTFINWAKGANDADVDKWNSFFADNPDLADAADIAKMSIDISEGINRAEVPPSQTAAALSNLKNRIGTIDVHQAPVQSKFPTVKVLLGVVIAVILAFAFWTYLGTVASTDTSVQFASQQEIQDDLLLQDGSKVTLNQHSLISYDESDPRSIKLEGEAFFEVSKDLKNNAKFSVTTQDLIVEVLGTQFNVEVTENSTQVYLKEGSIHLKLLGADEKSIAMQPGDFVIYSIKDKSLTNEKSFDLKHIGWKENIQFFEESDLRNVVLNIQNIYGIDIDIQGVSSEELFTGGIPTNNLDIALETIRNIYQIKIKKEDKAYILTK